MQPALAAGDGAEVPLEVPDDRMHGDPLVLGDGARSRSATLLAHVQRHESLERAVGLERVEQGAGLGPRPGAELDQRSRVPCPPISARRPPGSPARARVR